MIIQYNQQICKKVCMHKLHDIFFKLPVIMQILQDVLINK